MKCLPPTDSYYMFMHNYFTSFCLLTHHDVDNIWVTGVPKYTINEDKQLQKMECGHFEQRKLCKKRHCNFGSGWLPQQQGRLDSFFWT